MYLHQAQQEQLYIYVNRKTREKYGPAAEWETGCSDKVHQKSQCTQCLLYFIFTCRTSLQESQTPGSSDKVWHKEAKPLGG